MGRVGVEDDVEALAWHTLAAADGHAEARTRQLHEEVRNRRSLG